MKMTRAEFIKTIMELYPNTFNPSNEAQYRGWVNRYKSIIPENWNFEKLLFYFDTEWKSAVTPPHPSFFLEFRNDVKPVKPVKVEKIEVSPEEDILIQEKFKQVKAQMEKLAEEKTLKLD